MKSRKLLTLLLIGFITVIITNSIAAQVEHSAYPPADQIIVEDIYNRLNTLRTRRNLHPYQLNPTLNAAAQDQAAWLVDTGIRTHRRPDGSTARTRVEATGYHFEGWCCGENYYMSIDATPDLVWNFWVGSAGHYANLTHRNFEEVGIGMTTDGYRISYVMVFATPFDPTEAPPENPAEIPAMVETGIEAGGAYHTVQRGETLLRISQRYGVTVQQLSAANGISNASLIYAGQQLVVPGGAANESPPDVQIAAAPEPQAAQPVAAVTEVQSAPPVSTDGTYIIQSGENLYRIAQRYGVTVEALAAANGITDPRQLSVGQVLIIPGGELNESPPDAQIAAAPEVQSAPPVAADGTYTIQSGDNLYRIAQRYSVTVEALAAANGITDPRQLSVGQVLVIPQDT